MPDRARRRELIGPHRVKLDKANQWLFSTRAANGRQAFDYHGLRSAFLLSASRSERIRAFRDDRISQFVPERASGSNPYFQIFLVPVSVLDAPQVIDVRSYRDEFAFEEPIFNAWRGPTSGRYNLAGCVPRAAVSSDQPKRRAWTVKEFHFGRNPADSTAEVDLLHLDETMLTAFWEIFLAARYLRVPTPIVVMPVLIGVAGQHANHHHELFDSLHFEDRDPLVLPEIVLDQIPETPFSDDIVAKCKQVAPAVRDVIIPSGTQLRLHGSLNFDEVGKFAPRRRR